MIVVESFIKTASGEFVPFGMADDVASDLDLVEGAIAITIGDAPLLGTRNWDYVFPLWAYMAAALGELRATGEGALRFPDQPVGLDLCRVAGGVRLRVWGDGPDREAIVSELQFVQAVRARGKEFFGIAIARFPEERSLVERSLSCLLGDPPGMVLSDVRWEERLDRRQVAAFRHVERVSRYQFSPAERERIISRVAGTRATFEECVALIMTES
ncbi:hypothetical protein [Streptomyces sp. TE5632]